MLATYTNGLPEKQNKQNTHTLTPPPTHTHNKTTTKNNNNKTCFCTFVVTFPFTLKNVLQNNQAFNRLDDIKRL